MNPKLTLRLLPCLLGVWLFCPLNAPAECYYNDLQSCHPAGYITNYYLDCPWNHHEQTQASSSGGSIIYASTSQNPESNEPGKTTFSNVTLNCIWHIDYTGCYNEMLDEPHSDPTDTTYVPQSSPNC